MASTTPHKVLVTGANGFLASHLCKILLEKGYTVHACVRNASNPDSVKHLVALPNAPSNLKLFSTGDYADATLKGRFDAPMKGCCAVFHAATPIAVKFDGDCDGERDIFQPAMTSTQELLNSITSSHGDSVKCLVLTSSMAAVAPRPEPDVKDESHWSDPEQQRARDNWYGCTKTTQEKMVQDFVRDSLDKGVLSRDFKYVAICPTMVIGPMLNRSSTGGVPSGTMGTLVSWLKGGKPEAPNDSMSFIHVEDCATMHVAAFESPMAEGRYMSLVESLHWNDIAVLLKKYYPEMKEIKLYEGEDKARPTQFNLQKMESLVGTVKSTEEVLSESIDYLKSIGALG